MKANLIKTSECAIVYGTFRGQENQELFRCPIELVNEDLRNYVTRERIFLQGFQDDSKVQDLHNVPNREYIGYWRMYFSNGSWGGRWFFEKERESVKQDICGIDDICNWITEKFPHGCDWDMIEWLMHFPTWGSENRYLIKPSYSDRFKVMFDTTYRNGDYPVRIYVYGDKEGVM